MLLYHVFVTSEGIPNQSFDGRGNYSMGLQEQTVFPEIDPDKVKNTEWI